MVKVRLELVSADFPLDEDFIHAASQATFCRGLYAEDGTPLVMGINTPTREQIAHAEAAAASPCLKCSRHHRPWESCSRSERKRQMAKDKGKKKKDKKAKDVEVDAPVDPMEAAGVLDTNSDLDAIVTDLSDLLVRLRGLNVAAADAPAATPEADAPAPEKGKKKGKKDKGADEPIEATVTYTEKQLNKIGEKGAEGRKELVGILTSLGVSEDDLKGKRYTTLISMVLSKQEELKSGDAGEFTAEGTEGGEDEGWGDEDVPPADAKAEKKAKKKKKSKK